MDSANTNWCGESGPSCDGHSERTRACPGRTNWPARSARTWPARCTSRWRRPSRTASTARDERDDSGKCKCTVDQISETFGVSRKPSTATSAATNPSQAAIRADNQDRVVNSYLFRPEFQRARKLWFVDVILDSADAIWPFLRLSVARYQPNSIPAMEFSEVVATDFMQLPPERIGTVSRPASDEVRVSITGVTALTNLGPGVELPEDEDERRAKLLELLPKSRRVLATLQARSPKSESDIDWVDIVAVPIELADVRANTFEATWSAVLPLKPELQLLTPGTSGDLRVQVEEYELLPADPPQGEQMPSTTERLVYADHFPL
jgi:hypothetical protein